MHAAEALNLSPNHLVSWPSSKGVKWVIGIARKQLTFPYPYQWMDGVWRNKTLFVPYWVQYLDRAGFHSSTACFTLSVFMAPFKLTFEYSNSQSSLSSNFPKSAFLNSPPLIEEVIKLCHNDTVSCLLISRSSKRIL